MPYQNRQLERDALLGLHAKLGTWAAVATYLTDTTGETIYGTLCNLVSKGRRNSPVISDALEALGLVPLRYKRIRRCVSGTPEEIKRLEKFLYWNGYHNLGDFVWQIVNHEDARDFWKGEYGVNYELE